jgi:hypothetical protein
VEIRAGVSIAALDLFLVPAALSYLGDHLEEQLLQDNQLAVEAKALFRCGRALKSEYHVFWFTG